MSRKWRLMLGSIGIMAGVIALAYPASIRLGGLAFCLAITTGIIGMLTVPRDSMNVGRVGIAIGTIIIGALTGLIFCALSDWCLKMPYGIGDWGFGATIGGGIALFSHCLARGLGRQIRR
jgi:hypothetical protein